MAVHGDNSSGGPVDAPSEKLKFEIFTVYQITNLVNGLRYVGATTATIETRWREHVKKSRRGRNYVNVVIREFGADRFEITAIAQCRNVEDLRKLERDVIVQEGTIWPNGLNKINGGGYKPRGMKFSVEAIEVLRTKSIRYAATPEGREAKVRAFLGKKHTDSARRKMSLSMKGRIFTEDHRENLSIGQRRRRLNDPPKDKQKRIPIVKTHEERSASAKIGWETKRSKGYISPRPTAEAIAKGVAKRRGQKRSEVSRQNMREAAARRSSEVWEKIAESRREAKCERDKNR